MTTWTFHGGRLSAARKLYGDRPEGWLDLSTGINPHAWPGVADVDVDWRGLPDEEELAALERAAAAHFGVEAQHVCAVPGSEIALRLLGILAPTKGAVHAVPGYRTHGVIFPEVVTSGPGALAEAALQGRSILIANPNNPDGRISDPEVLIGLARQLAGSKGWLVVDEAFADVCPQASVVRHVSDDVPLVVMRSFGKFFGLAGLRLGFVVGPQHVIQRFRATLGAWPVSTAAQRIGTKAYRDKDWITEMRATLATDADALDAVLARRGFRAFGACPLFRLIETDDVQGVFDLLLRRGILTRPFDYNTRWLRIGLPDSEAALARLDRALAAG